MSPETIKLIIAYIAVAIGGLSVFLLWVYAIEALKGVAVTEYQVYKRYVNVSYAFFVFISAVVWFSTTVADALFFWSLLIMSGLWLLSGFVIFILSFFASEASGKQRVRSTLIPCIIKTVVSALILMFIA